MDSPQNLEMFAMIFEMLVKMLCSFKGTLKVLDEKKVTVVIHCSQKRGVNHAKVDFSVQVLAAIINSK